jgi:hypothetical protein
MSTALFTAWIALLGTDRIDLLGGRGPILLLPFQLLTILVVVSEWRRRIAARTLPQITPDTSRFGALVLGLLALIALSILRSADVEVSLGRALLLTATAVGVPLAIWGAADRADLLALLGRGARAGLIVALVFNVLGILSLVGVVPIEYDAGPVRLLFETSVYELVPRLAGGASDMNRGGLIALVHTVLIAIAVPTVRGRRAWITLCAVLVIGSLSRSVLLAAIPALLFTPRLRTAPAAGRMALAIGLAAVAIGSSALLVPKVREATVRVTAPLGQRFSPQEGSAQAHAYLFTRAAEVGTRDVAGTLLGIGFGTSFRVLADFFAGNKYGNFHSTWLTLWVESGVFAMLIALALLALPLRRAGPLSGLFAGMIFYNAFYNGLSEPLLWVALALVWIAPEALKRGASLPSGNADPSTPVAA